MADVQELDLLGTALDGSNLIEASAGTGKTYAITGLFLRLVLELNLPVHEILVVTFTEAATSELKDRIRNRIREALDVFSGRETEDAFLRGLCERCPETDLARRKLSCALVDFDQAAIFTIHGFCLRTLQEHAFASGILFDAELVTDQERLVREAVQDFWREQFYEATPLFTHYARSSGFSLEGLRSLVGKNLFSPRLEVIPDPAPDTGDQVEHEDRFLSLFGEVSSAWPREREAVETLLLESPALKKNMYSAGGVRKWVEEMDRILGGECVSCRLGVPLEKLARSGIEQALKKGHAPPAHPFFDLCQDLLEAALRLQDAYSRRILGLRVAFVDHLRRHLERRKLARSVLFFDDLLVKLEEALSGPGGETLAAALRERYGAALIDEFQDTDSIQYSIFRRIFGGHGAPLFLIGDPKQAIYGFRGADIFSYMEAARETPRRWTLAENWRSEPGLISAVNAIFARADNPFIFEEISFHPARPAQAKRHERLQVDGHGPPSLQLWFLRAADGAGGKLVSREKARPRILHAVAAEISKLLDLGRQGRATIGDRPLREGDMAVLVRENREAREVQKALSALSVHAVLYSTESLFDTREAAEVQRLLSAVARPASERLIRSALATDLLGMSGEEMARLMEDEAGWEGWLLDFSAYHEAWSKFGFLRMFRQLLSGKEVLPRLMTLDDGERRCTNVLHLAEALHRAAAEQGLCMSALAKWLASRRDERAERADEHQLRLESDENAVKIVTIHKSKGLEYPIVFCPFPWRDSHPEKDLALFHDESRGLRLTLDLGSPQLEAHRTVAGREQLAENLRLLYVAVTRARNRCVLLWGPFNKAGTAAPAYLLHRGMWEGWDGSLASLDARFKELGEEALWADLEEIQAGSGGTVELLEMPAGEGIPRPAADGAAQDLECRRFTGTIDGTWGISSFSSLILNQPHRAELADHDDSALGAIPEAADSEEPMARERPLDIFSFPRGTASGILLHHIFEELDFTSADDRLTREVVLKAFGAQGMDPVWADAVCEMIRNVLGTSLPSTFGAFTLSQAPMARRLTELEFYLPLRRLGGAQLTELFTHQLGGNGAGGAGSSHGRFRLESVEGFLKGFIDLVLEINGRFYIVDWKSNFLGPTLEHYGQESLGKAIRDSLYDLQYTLYCVALHRYLGARMAGYRYDEHFGEVFYLFLRGMDRRRGPEYGVFRDRPSRESIEALAEGLTGR
jgi:exodeoxyribonuclease V beta subunit